MAGAGATDAKPPGTVPQWRRQVGWRHRVVADSDAPAECTFAGGSSRNPDQASGCHGAAEVEFHLRRMGGSGTWRALQERGCPGGQEPAVPQSETGFAFPAPKETAFLAEWFDCPVSDGLGIGGKQLSQLLCLLFPCLRSGLRFQAFAFLAFEEGEQFSVFSGSEAGAVSSFSLFGRSKQVFHGLGRVFSFFQGSLIAGCPQKRAIPASIPGNRPAIRSRHDL